MRKFCLFAAFLIVFVFGNFALARLDSRSPLVEPMWTAKRVYDSWIETAARETQIIAKTVFKQLQTSGELLASLPSDFDFSIVNRFSNTAATIFETAEDFVGQTWRLAKEIVAPKTLSDKDLEEIEKSLSENQSQLNLTKNELTNLQREFFSFKSQPVTIKEIKEIKQEIQRIIQPEKRIEIEKLVEKQIEVVPEEKLAELKKQLAELGLRLTSSENRLAHIPPPIVISPSGTASGSAISIITSADVFSANKFTVGTEATIAKLTVSGTTNLSSLTTSGDVTISGNLTVSGSQVFSGAQTITANSSSTVFAVNQQGTGGIVDFQKAGISKLFVDTAGNVGIGTTSPAALLSIAGNTYLTGGLGVGLVNTSANTVNLATGGSFQIAGISVLNATTLGSGVAGSSLTSVGTLTSGTLGAGFTTIAVARGGTGLATFGGANTLLYTTAADTLSSFATANNGVLVTSGTGVPSIATDIPTAVTIGGQYVYRVGGTDVALADGGLNASLTASNGGIFYSTASAGAILAGTVTANQVLLSGASAAPVWSTATYPTTTAINQLLYSSAANTIAGLATANSGVLVTSGTGIPSIATDIPTAVTIGGQYVYRVGGTDVAVADGGTGVSSWTNGQLLIGNTTGNTAALGTLTGTANQITVTNGASSITLSLPQSIATASTPQFARLGLGGAAHATDILTITSADTTADSKALNIAHSGAIAGTGYGLYVSKTGVSTTNIGGYFSASGATNNYGLIVTNGNVGIGTASPTERFQIQHSTGSAAIAVGEFEAAIGSYTGTSLIASNTLSAASTYNLFSAITDSDGDAGGPVTQFLIRGDGNVGIGTATPTARLQIGDSTVSTSNQIVFGKYETASQLYLPVIQQKSILSAGASNDLALGARSTNGGILFYTGGTSVGGSPDLGGALGTTNNAIRMVLNSSGNVGIGSTNKLSKLTIVGSADETNIGGTTIANASTTITGVGTTFLSKLGIGDRISLSSVPTTYATVTAIASDTSLTVSAALGDGTSQTINAKHSSFRVENSANAVQMVVDDQGNVGIGTAGPTAKLTVRGSGNTVTDWFRMESTAGFYRNIYLGGGADVYFASAANTASLSDAGVWTNASDIAYKTNIKDMAKYGLNTVLQMKPKEYQMKSDLTPQIGFIAQEMETIVPEVVSGKEGNKGIGYGQLTAVLTKAIQEQQKQIEELKAEMVFINLGYHKLDEQVSSSTLQVSGNWFVDQATGKIKTSLLGDFDFENRHITKIRSIISASGNWSIDENGNIKAQKVITEKLELGGYCVTVENNALKTTAGSCDQPPTSTESTLPSGAEPTPTPEPAPTSTPTETPIDASIPSETLTPTETPIDASIPSETLTPTETSTETPTPTSTETPIETQVVEPVPTIPSEPAPELSPDLVI